MKYVFQFAAGSSRCSAAHGEERDGCASRAQDPDYGDDPCEGVPKNQVFRPVIARTPEGVCDHFKWVVVISEIGDAGTDCALDEAGDDSGHKHERCPCNMGERVDRSKDE